MCRDMCKFMTWSLLKYQLEQNIYLQHFILEFINALWNGSLVLLHTFSYCHIPHRQARTKSSALRRGWLNALWWTGSYDGMDNLSKFNVIFKALVSGLWNMQSQIPRWIRCVQERVSFQQSTYWGLDETRATLKAEIVVHVTDGCRYNTVQYNMILYASLLWRMQNIN